MEKYFQLYTKTKKRGGGWGGGMGVWFDAPNCNQKSKHFYKRKTYIVFPNSDWFYLFLKGFFFNISYV